MSALAAGPYAFTVSPSATTYLAAGGNLTLTVNLSYGSSISALDLSLTTPTGWKYVSASGTAVPQTSPQPGDLGQGGLAFVYTAMPVSPASFSFTVSYPAGMSGNKSLTLVGANFTDETTSAVTAITAPNITLTSTGGAPGLTAAQALGSTILTAGAAVNSFTPVTSAGGSTPYVYSVIPGLPAGLSMASDTGAITGTPTLAGTNATYTVTVTDGTHATASNTFSLAVIGLAGSSNATIAGAGFLAGAGIPHPNGNIYDQVLLTGNVLTIANGANKVTRTSFIDLNDDIVQIEFGGAGTLTISLTDSSGPAAPVNYNQPAVSYMKGHASIVISAANETTNLTIFSVGRATAFDPTGAYDILLPVSATNAPASNGSPLFVGHSGTSYDGVADIARVTILSSNGKFGGIRSANASYLGTTGITGIMATGVQFTGPVYIGDIDASGTALPEILLGSATVTQINGGDLQQSNAQPVSVSGVTQLQFVSGVTSNNAPLPAQTNKAVLKQNGVDVTTQIVVNPTP